MEEDPENIVQPGLATNIHKLTVIVNGSGLSEKDLEDQMIGSDLKARVAVPHSRLFAFDATTNSQIDVGDLDLITNRYGDRLRLVQSSDGNVREAGSSSFEKQKQQESLQTSLTIKYESLAFDPILTTLVYGQVDMQC